MAGHITVCTSFHSGKNCSGEAFVRSKHAFVLPDGTGYGGTLGRYLMDKGADSSIRNRSGLVGVHCAEGACQSR